MGRKKIIEDEQLLMHARTLFLEKGIQASTKDIATLAGISQATLFQRFPTKEALFHAAIVIPKPDTNAILGAALDHADPVSALSAICEAMLTYFRAMMPLALQLWTHPAISLQDMQGQFQKNNPALLGNALTEHLRELNQGGKASIANPASSAFLLVAAIHSLALFELMGAHGGQFPPSTINAMVDSLWRGMATDKNTTD